MIERKKELEIAHQKALKLQEKFKKRLLLVDKER